MNHELLWNITIVSKASRASGAGFSWPSSSTKYMRSNG